MKGKNKKSDHALYIYIRKKVKKCEREKRKIESKNHEPHLLPFQTLYRHTNNVELYFYEVAKCLELKNKFAWDIVGKLLIRQLNG